MYDLRKIVPAPPSRRWAPRRTALLLPALLLGLGAGAAPPAQEPARTDRPNSPAAPTPGQAPASAPASAPDSASASASARPLSRLHGPDVTLREWTSTRPNEARSDDPHRVMLGRLMYSRVDVRCDDATVKESLQAVASAIGVNLVTKFDVDFVDDTPVSLELKDVSGLDALEAIISQGGADATWQLHGGMMEIGSRAFLARPSARRSASYLVADLTLDVHWKRNWLPKQPELEPDDELMKRRTPTQNAADLIQSIAMHVEPEAWQPRPHGDGSHGTRGLTPEISQSRGGSYHGARNQSARGDRNFDAAIGPPFVNGKWASMTFRPQDGQLVVAGPDFIHRMIAGYPSPLPVALEK